MAATSWSPSFRVGLKVYDNDWYLKYDLSYDAAAELLEEWGVTFVLAQCRALPMPDTAVQSEVPPKMQERYAAYDDREFRDALARRSIAYVATCLMMFDPVALNAHPEYQAVGDDGKAMEFIDWYSGIPPTRQAHVNAKITAIAAAVQELEPDGVHLGFMRWPGFWELWMPEHQRGDFPEYSYDAESLEQFSRATGIALPDTEPAAAARWINANARTEWSDWKCSVVCDVIGQVRQAIQEIKPDCRIVLNTVPFGRSDYDNAEEQTFGQRFEQLADVVDVFEVMTYHQILKRPTSWIPAIGEEVRERSGKTTVCTLQAAPLYLDGMHAAAGRSPSLGLDEFRTSVNETASSGVDGLVFFTWSDFLRQIHEENDSTRVDVIRSIPREPGKNV